MPLTGEGEAVVGQALKGDFKAGITAAVALLLCLWKCHGRIGSQTVAMPMDYLLKIIRMD
jgi:hypothetical protein